jgi:Holliday junction resolvasome RuvABC DNA-binding subunit
MTNDFSRNLTRTNIVPIKSDLTGLAAREQRHIEKLAKDTGINMQTAERITPEKAREIIRWLEGQKISESNRLAREQWAAAQANQERREQQDKALAYLASKQMEKDASFLSRLRRLFQ